MDDTGGDLWFNSANGNQLSIWNGTAWVLSKFGNLAVANLDAGAITTGSIAAARIAAGTINASMIATGTITSSQISSATITGTNIAGTTITASNLVANTITAAQIAANTITANQIAANTITAGNIQAGALTSASGVFGAIDASIITTGKLSANYISGGILTLGGANNGNGIFQLNSSSGSSIVTMNNAGINVSNINFNLVNGSDNVVQFSKDSLSNCGIELGSVTKSNTPYIDFHSSGTNVDYDTRIIASNGNSSVGQGSLAIYSSVVSVNSNFIVNGNVTTSGYLVTSSYINIANSSGGATLIPSSGGLVIENSNSGSWWCQMSDAGTTFWHSVTVVGTLYSSSNGYYPSASNISSFQFVGGNPCYLQIATTNNGYWGASLWSSDISLKSNIADSSADALGQICNIPIRQFDWKDGRGHVGIGVVSQELMEINPDFAFGVEQPDGSMLYQPNESVLITATIGAIKQLAEKNDALANRVSVLESQIAAMQSQINKLLD